MPVLGTKRHLPSPRRGLVQRARRSDGLRADGDDRPRLVLVAAPAGPAGHRRRLELRTVERASSSLAVRSDPSP